jgi:hypothetical protein
MQASRFDTCRSSGRGKVSRRHRDSARPVSAGASSPATWRRRRAGLRSWIAPL